MPPPKESAGVTKAIHNINLQQGLNGLGQEQCLTKGLIGWLIPVYHFKHNWASSITKMASLGLAYQAC